MAVKLHRCSNLWVKIGGHPCWRVQQALAARIREGRLREAGVA